MQDKQKGISLIGGLIVAAMVVMLAILAMKVIPTVIEYRTLDTVVKRLAQPDADVATIKEGFKRARELEQGIVSVNADDLEIDRAGGQTNIRLAYDKEIPIWGPAYIVMKYNIQHSSGKSD